MGLIHRCLCGASPQGMAPVRHGDVAALRCDCGVQHLQTDLSRADYEAQYMMGYHTATERRSTVKHNGAPAAFADRYDHDFALAQKRLRRYCSMMSIERRDILTALDVGCANGAFVDYLIERGIDARGIDPDPSMARRGVATGSVGELLEIGELAPGSFDLVTYHDVLEHTLEPAAELFAAVKLLTPGGALVVDVPDVSTPAGHHHYKPEHVWYFTAAALTTLMRDAGLEYCLTDQPIAGKIVIYGRFR
jgi:2-polyprenyl-3-methyl-5-hydroxy-6-metoxy-1,4-benzoquinol methylase